MSIPSSEEPVFRTIDATNNHVVNASNKNHHNVKDFYKGRKSGGHHHRNEDKEIIRLKQKLNKLQGEMGHFTSKDSNKENVNVNYANNEELDNECAKITEKLKEYAPNTSRPTSDNHRAAQ